MRKPPPVIVEPLLPTGGRPVRIKGERVGIAHSPRDLRHFLDKAGYANSELIRLDDTTVIEWVGGGVETW
ncbi:hypothetical protein [Streptomyces sp. NPDC000880]